MADITTSTTGEWQASQLDQALREIDVEVDGRAEAIRADHRHRRQRIEQDRDLNELARPKKLDETRAGALEQMQTLRQEFARKQADAIEHTEAVLLGRAPSGDPAKLQLFREARHRARQLSDQDAALDAMRNALADHDRELVEAIAAHALEHGWRRVWQAWPEGGAGVEMSSRARAGATGGRGQLFRFSV